VSTAQGVEQQGSLITRVARWFDSPQASQAALHAA
jgi:hypothetical protein